MPVFFAFLPVTVKRITFVPAVELVQGEAVRRNAQSCHSRQWSCQNRVTDPHLPDAIIRWSESVPDTDGMGAPRWNVEERVFDVAVDRGERRPVRTVLRVAVGDVRYCPAGDGDPQVLGLVDGEGRGAC